MQEQTKSTFANDYPVATTQLQLLQRRLWKFWNQYFSEKLLITKLENIFVKSVTIQCQHAQPLW